MYSEHIGNICSHVNWTHCKRRTEVNGLKMSGKEYYMQRQQRILYAKPYSFSTLYPSLNIPTKQVSKTDSTQAGHSQKIQWPKRHPGTQLLPKKTKPEINTSDTDAKHSTDTVTTSETCHPQSQAILSWQIILNIPIYLKAQEKDLKTNCLKMREVLKKEMNTWKEYKKHDQRITGNK